MKLSFSAVAFKAAFLSVALAMSFFASAQGAIERISEPYVAKPDIRFVIASTEITPIETIIKTSTPVVVAPQAWSVKTGSLLRETLQEWTTRAGWSLVWALPPQDDFRLDAGNSYEGNFKVAIHALFDSLPSNIRIRAELRPDNTPPLLYVSIEEGAR